MTSVASRKYRSRSGAAGAAPAMRRTILPVDHDLERFVRAQEGVYGDALGQLRAGVKTRHWMWFIFPQLAGLGRSETARYFAIRSVDEARAYLAHPVLGPRLRECSRAVLDVRGRSAEAILGGIDAMKLRSSMTLFQRADPQEAAFREVLERYYAGQPDELTEALLG